MSNINKKTSDFPLVNPDTVDVDMTIPIIRSIVSYTKHYWLYALLLDDGTYFIGYTGDANPYDKIAEQGSEIGAKWLKKHKPTEVVEVRDAGDITSDEAKRYGQKLRHAYMLKYGYRKIAMFNYYFHSSYLK